MVDMTVSSVHGPLTVHKDKRGSPYWKLPNLHFHTFDLVIKLDHDPKLWLLVHTEVFLKTCPFLAPSFTERWSKSGAVPGEIENPHTGDPVRFRTRALKHVDDTYVLEGEDLLVDQHYDHVAFFSKSSLAQPGWPDIPTYPSTKLDLTRRALRILISLLYRAELDCLRVALYNEIFEPFTVSIRSDIIPLVVTVCAIAEYWGCLEKIKAFISDMLKSSPTYWEDVAESPERHFLVAVKLEDAEIYRSALRHMIARAHQTDQWQELAELTGWDKTELRNLYKPELDTLRHLVQELGDTLQGLQLHPVPIESLTGPEYFRYTRLIDVMPFKKLRPSPAKVVARFIYGEYWTFQMSGVAITHGRDYRTVKPARRLNLLIHRIEQAAKSPNPAALFDAVAAVHYADIFKLSKRETREVEKHLRDLVLKANEVIASYFDVRLSVEHINASGRFEKGGPWINSSFSCTQDRARYDAAWWRYFTYMKIPNSLPWDTEDGDTEDSQSDDDQMPDVSVRDVSPEWVSALAKHYGVSVETANAW